MNATVDEAHLPDTSQEGFAPVKDRLTTTLFLAALFHGIVILGVTFAAPRGGGSPTPTLEVLLLTGPDLKAADNPTAQYLAQRNQIGSGTTDERVRPANPASSLLSAEQDGLPDGNGSQYRESTSGERSTEFVSARSDRSEVSFRSGENNPAQQAEIPLALAPTSPSPIATNATDNTLRLRGRQDGQYEVVPNTRESKIAPYLDAWRRKVERLGTMNFPQIARQRGALTGNPVLEVAISADGKLTSSLVRRSSGRKDLDQAAQSILRLASPFDPFPADLRKQYDELRFAYEWQFLDGAVGQGTLSVPTSTVRPAQ
jgi:protein TonB